MPWRNSTTSDPSRTAPPSRAAEAASSRPCRLIHTLCQPSMTTAANRIAASNNSWPIPATARLIAPAPPATAAAPSTPPAMPSETQRPRPGAPRLAAMTMPTTSAASSTSRSTMIAVGNMRRALYFDDDAAGLPVEIVEELVAPGIERADEDAGLAPGRNDLFAVQHRALELAGGRLLVAHNQLDLDPGRHRHLGRDPLVISQHDRHLVVVGTRRQCGDQQQEGGTGGGAHRNRHLQLQLVLGLPDPGASCN